MEIIAQQYSRPKDKLLNVVFHLDEIQSNPILLQNFLSVIGIYMCNSIEGQSSEAAQQGVVCYPSK